MTGITRIALGFTVCWPALAVAVDPIPGSGKAATEVREITEFEAVRLEIAGDVAITVGQPGPLTIQADEDVLPLIETKVVGGKLQITARRSLKSQSTIKVTGSAANVALVEMLGSGDVSVTGLDNNKFKIDLRGSGDISVTGKTSDLDVKVVGSGDVSCYDLTAVHATVAIKGSGDVKVRAEATLNVRIVGSGECSYKGAPSVKAQVIGSGDVKKRGG